MFRLSSGSCPSLWCLWCAFVVSLVGSVSPWAHAQDNALSAGVCAKLAQGNAYPEAAQCFLRVANAMDKPTLSPVEKKLKGLYLINAAKLMQKEANRQKNSEASAYFREQAAEILQKYLDQKLCSRDYKCKEIQGTLWDLNKKINYSQMTLLGQDGATGKVTVQGHKFQKELSFPSEQSEKLRPGKYRLIVVYKDQQTRLLDVALAPGKTKVVTIPLSPSVIAKRNRVPVRAPQAPIWPWILAGGGLAVAITGAALLGVGSSAAAARDQAYEFLESSSKITNVNPNSVPSNTEEKHEAVTNNHATATTMFLAGWIVGGVGVAALVAGIVTIVVTRPKAPPPEDATSLRSAPQAPHTARVLGHFSF